MATAPSTGDALDRIRDAEFVLLTTFKRDGSAVPTPVWAMPTETPEGRGIRVWTQKRTGKVKRIRNVARVQIAPCTRMGRVTGETLDATARLLDERGTLQTLAALRRKYGWQGRFIAKRARKKLDASIGIEIVRPGMGS